jgi:hypothetical protein
MLQSIKKIKFICDRCGAECARDAPLVDAIRAARGDGWQVSDDRLFCWCPACKAARSREAGRNRSGGLFDYSYPYDLMDSS